MSFPRILAFDSRRGNREGQEIRKILAFYPSATPPVEQINTAGLLQGLLLFSSNFSQAGWEVVETDKYTWVVCQTEHCIWFALGAPHSWLPRHSGESNLHSLLVQAYHGVTLLHGSINELFCKDDGGKLAQRAIQPTLDHFGRQLGSSLTWQHRQLRNPLGDVALAPLLRLPPLSSLAAQDLCSALQLTSLGGKMGVQGVVLLWQQCVITSTLAPDDLAAVYSLAATALLHPQSSGQQAAADASRPSVLDSGCWHQLASKFVVLRPGCWGADFPTSSQQQRGQKVAGDDKPSEEPSVCVPLVWLQAGQARCQLVAYKEGRLWALLLVSAGVALTQQSLRQLSEAVEVPAQELAAQVSQELRSTQPEPGHVPGYRYLYRNSSSGTAMASPRVKVSAMLHHSRALAACLRDSLSLLQPPHQDGTSQFLEESPSQSSQRNGVAAGPHNMQLGEATTSSQALGAVGSLGHEPAVESACMQSPSPGSASSSAASAGGPGSPRGVGILGEGLAGEGGDCSHREEGIEGEGEDTAPSAGHAAEGVVDDGGKKVEGGVGNGVRQSLQRLSIGASESDPAEQQGPEGGGEAAASHVQAATHAGAGGGGPAESDMQSLGTGTTGEVALQEGVAVEEQDHTQHCSVEGSRATALSVAQPATVPEGQTAMVHDAVRENEAPVLIPAAVEGANEVYDVFVRSNQDCWGVARVRDQGEQQLLVVREKRMERTVEGAAPVMDAFADGYLY